MYNSIQKRMLPLSICTTFFGFYTIDVKNKKFKHIVTCHGWLLIGLFITYFILYTMMKLIISPFNMDLVVSILAELVRATMLAYYSVKFIVQSDVIDDVMECINYADKRLKRIGVNVPHAKEQTLCASYTVLITLYYVIRSVFAIYIWLRPRSFATLREMLSLIYGPAKVATYFASGMLTTHSVFLLYTVKKRMTRFRRAVGRIEEFFAREIAWDSVVTVSVVVDTPREENFTTQKEKYFVEVQKLNNCMFETLQGVRKFYEHYFLFQVLFYILKKSILLLLCAVERMPLYSMCFVGWNTLLMVVSVILSVNIQYEFQAVQILVKKFYWSKKLKHVDPRRTTVKKLWIQSIHRDHIFDCGFFDVDVSVLKIVFNFLLYLFFAMIPMYM